MDNAQYHMAAAWGSSQLKLLPDSPELFAARYITREYPQEESSAMDLGTAVHSDLLGGDGWELIPPEVLTSNGRRQGKAWEQFQADNASKLLLLPNDAAKVQAMVASVRAEPMAARLLGMPGPCEESIFWTDKETGLPLKCRPDKRVIFPDDTVVADLKTSNDPTQSAFQWRMYDLGYHRQAAHYIDGLATIGIEGPAWVFIVVRNAPPYECRVYELDQEAINFGREINREALIDLAKRLETNNWRGPSWGRCQPIDLPKRAYQERTT